MSISFAAVRPPRDSDHEALHKKLQGVAVDLFGLTLSGSRAASPTAITDLEKVQACFFLFSRLQKSATPARSEA